MFDVIVIGAGPAGYQAAIRAGQLEKKCLIIEEDRLGGTCLNRGCIPTKSLLHASLSPDFSYAKAEEEKNTLVEGLVTGIGALLDAYPSVTRLSGTATITGPGQVEVDGSPYEGKAIVIASGSQTRRFDPPVPVLYSDDILNFGDKDFQSLIIIGAGVIGLEFAQLYHNRGCEVTVLESMPKILPPFDKDLVQSLGSNLRKLGIQVITGAEIHEIQENSVRFTAKKKEETLKADAVIATIGRIARPVPSQIDFEMERGRYQVDEHFQTSVKGIYAVGDASSAIQLAHLASAQAIQVIEELFDEKPSQNLALIPSVLYTQPSMAMIGLTEAAAKEAGHEYLISKGAINSVAMIQVQTDLRCFVKLVIEKDTRKILGAHVLAPGAEELIHLFQLAMQLDASIDQVRPLVFSHPSLGEAFKDILDQVDGVAIHKMPPRKR